MAQPQGLNIPAILTTGAVGVILTMAVIEGVRAYYNYYNNIEEALKWDMVRFRTADELRKQQLAALETGSIPIGDAMHRIATSGGKLPATQPAVAPVQKPAPVAAPTTPTTTPAATNRPTTNPTH